MARFRFRAQAALDFRRRQLELAQGNLANCEREREVARRGMADADAACVAAREEMRQAITTTTPVTELQWYRFWIVRLDLERAGRVMTLTAREADVSAAAAACLQARQQCESLERFRARARVAYDAAQAAAERLLIDELATRQFVARRTSEGAAS